MKGENMCCGFATLALFGPRVLMFFWWLVRPGYFNAAFPSAILAILGFLFAPWLTLAYVLVFPGGVNGLDWVMLGLALLVDLASYGVFGKESWKQYKK